MKTGLILTIGSLGFLILLLVSYYLQQRITSNGRKLYRILLLIILIFLVSEIASSYYLAEFRPEIASSYYVFQIHSGTINIIILRIHGIAAILWFMVLYLYSICFLKDVEEETISELIKKDRRCLRFTAFTIISTIVYFLIPFGKMTYETFTFIPVPTSYPILLYAFVTVVLLTILMLKRKSEIDVRSKNAVIIMVIEIIIIVPLQIIFPRTSILGLGAVLQMYFLYFYVENPDLLMIGYIKNLKKEIDRSNLAKTDFLSNMSHEIRSPMNAIVGFSETILNNPNFDSEMTRGDIEHIATAGNNLLDIINNILDISKIESGSEVLEEKEYSVGNIIMELSSIIDARLANRPIKFIPEIDSNIPKKVYGDSTKLFQVLLNVLTNSIKYTEVGKIRLIVNQEIKNNNVTLKFKISDTGYGIKKEDYDKLFEKFSRLNSATTNEIEGTGLGLVITKKYVDLLGGKIWFESDYGVGTTFFVEVSQKIIDATPIGNIRETTNHEEGINYLDCSGKKVLIVDDNKLNLKVSKRILSNYKFEVDTITSGKECVYKIKEGQKYDMIFLDHMMPEMDGIEVIHILRKLIDYDIPPVIALTANAITGVKDMYLKEGFDEYLSKPINMAELNRLIIKYFGYCDIRKHEKDGKKITDSLENVEII